ncbi:MAG: sugar transferase [Ferruginibacter sp.]
MLTTNYFFEDEEIMKSVQNIDTFLFIEDEQKDVEDYHSFYSESYFTSSFTNAQKLLKDLEINNALPEMIVIDTPLDLGNLLNFRKWMETNITISIPFIYNAENLSNLQIKAIFENKLADDIVNLSSHYTTLSEKAKFLKKIKGTIKSKTIAKKVSLSASPCKFCFAKRFLDITLSTIAIIMCLPIFLLIALAIRLESRGPIFYCANRAGKGFKVFKFFKFRTMVVDADKKVAELAKLNMYEGADEKGPKFFKVKNDPRITRLGSFLRNTSLDELPQLFNVLIGDMSIVGNRPLPLYEANSLTTDEFAERFMAPAGITGLWQISKRGKEDMSISERMSLDIKYARSSTLKGDLKIIWKTPSVLLQKTNV